MLLPEIIKVDPADLKCQDSILRQKSAPVEAITSEIKDLVRSMIAAMYNVSYGTGLSAIQIGIPLQVFVLNMSREPGKEIVAINPKVVSISDQIVVRKEGCLCLPNYMGLVERANQITIMAQNIQEKTFKHTSIGYESAIIQHELDHLEGILYWDRMREGTFPEPINKFGR